jgi:hypothetical protein
MKPLLQFTEIVRQKNLINNISIFRGIFYPVNKKPGHFIVKVQLNKGEVMLAQEEW